MLASTGRPRSRFRARDIYQHFRPSRHGSARSILTLEAPNCEVVIFTVNRASHRAFSAQPLTPTSSSPSITVFLKPLGAMAAHVSLLTATDARRHVHLIVGSNSLAASRCGQSVSVGASPVLVAPETAELHYALRKRVEDGEVKWTKKVFEDDDVLTLGRHEVGNVVDAVFVTSSPREPLSKSRVQLIFLRTAG
jgi:hypothetical protein